MAVTLSVTKGPAKGKVFTFTEHDTFLFGRMPDCHATFPDDTQVSRHHFILEACPPKASLRDLGSLNGTFVNGKKITKQALADGDKIQISSSTIFKFALQDLSLIHI